VGPAPTFEHPFVGVVDGGTIVGSFCEDESLKPISGTEETSARYLWHFVDLHEFLDYYLAKLESVGVAQDRVAEFERVSAYAKVLWPNPFP
jgi:hypothetical protein